MPIITDEFRTANHYEAGLWFVIAAMALGFAIKHRGHVRNRCAILGATLIAFGFSDVYEATTGAWWRPWWLLVWKVVCTAVMILLLIEHYRRQFHARRDASPVGTISSDDGGGRQAHRRREG